MKEFNSLFSAPLPQSSSGANYKIKWVLETIDAENKQQVGELAAQLDEINLDPNKNEKIGITLKSSALSTRSIINNKINIDYKNLPPPLSGQDFIALIEEYAIYVKENYPPSTCIELECFYYPLDPSNKVCEISEDDKGVDEIMLTHPNKDTTIQVAILRESKETIDKKRIIHTQNKVIKAITSEKEKLSSAIALPHPISHD